MNVRKKAQRENDKHDEKAYFAADKMLSVMFDAERLLTCAKPLKNILGHSEKDNFLNAVICFLNKEYVKAVYYSHPLLFDNSMFDDNTVGNETAKWYYLRSIAYYASGNYNDAAQTNKEWKDNVDVLDARYYYRTAITNYQLQKPFAAEMIEAILLEPSYYKYIKVLQNMMHAQKMAIPQSTGNNNLLLTIFNQKQGDIESVLSDASEKEREMFLHILGHYGKSLTHDVDNDDEDEENTE